MRPRWIAALGLAWSAVYNTLWTAAWFAFMRREWTEAAAAANTTMPWTPDFWLVWIPLTLPFGMAIAAFLASRAEGPGRTGDALLVTSVVGVPATVGMAAFVWHAGLPWSVLLTDSAVNLLAFAAASLVVAKGVAARARGPGPTSGA